eukprot:284486-Alexandrium_andersonii.AAC.1
MADGLYQAWFDGGVSTPSIGRVGNKELPNNEQPSVVAWGSSGQRVIPHVTLRAGRSSNAYV